MGSKLYLCALEVMAYVSLSVIQLISDMLLDRAKILGKSWGLLDFGKSGRQFTGKQKAT